MTILEVHLEQKRFATQTGDDFVALAGLDLRVANGEFACLVGPSGCGKSTLLNIIGGLDRDVEGAVILNGVTLDSAAPAGNISYVFQTPRLMPWLTVLDNVRLVLGNDPVATTHARELLVAMELGGFLDTYPNRISGGMQRRVALARAFATEPRLLLLDEPFVSLDVPVANRLRSMLIELWQTHNATVLFVTHDLAEALALGDRIVFMSASPGRVVLELPVELPRPRSPGDPEVVALERRLLAEHPDLLAGLLEAEESEQLIRRA